MATEDRIVTGQITLIEVNDGGQGDPGVDANMLDWVKDWNSNLTMIDSTMVVTPKIFAGVKNSDNTLTGVALGCFSLSVKEDSGAIVTEQIDGVYSFCGGYKTFSLDSSGNVEVGRGSQSIKYNSTTGKIEFGADVSMAWVGATYIDSNGIFTGSLSANTVNAISITATQITSGYISSDRIAAGSIIASKLDATSIKSEIINTDYINGLSCTFTRGSIGGWTIADGTLSSGQIAISAVYKRVVVYGSSSGVASGHRVQLFYNSDADFGFYASNSLGASVVQLGTTNQIAGWQITASAIYKNSVYLGADGSLYNSGKWTLANDGSGSLASGNISWDASGNVSFGSSVSLNWTTLINQGKLYVRGTGYNNSTTRMVILNGTTIVNDGARGFAVTVISRDTLAHVSTTYYDVYADEAYCTTMATQLNSLGATYIVVVTSYDAIRVNATLSTALQRCGASDWTTGADRVPYALIGIPNIGKNNGIEVRFTTSATDPYAELSTTIENGVPLGINTNGKILTYISGSGIYTGSLSAEQITAGTINAARIDTASLKATLITAANINALTLTTTTGYIGGWSVTSTSIAKNSVSLGADGTISNSTKWSFKNDGSGFIASGNISWDSAGTVTFSSTVALQWTSKIDSLTTSLADVTDNAKTTTMDLTSLDQNTYYPVIMALGTSKRATILVYNTLGSSSKPSWATHTNGFSCECEWTTIGSGWGTRSVIRSVLRSSYAWSNALPFGNITQMTNSSLEVIYLRGGGVYYFKTTNVGSIYYVTSTYTSNTQSVAPISSVTQPVADVDQINSALGGTSYPKLTYIDSTGVYTGTLTATQVNAVAINASSITTGTLSADRIATGSIYATKLNAASIQSDIINATYINGLTCTFAKGTVGGWSIGSDNITAGTIGGDGQMPMQIRTTSSGSGYWYSGAYKPFGVSMTWHKSNNAGHIVIGQVAASGYSAKTGFMGIQMMSWDHLEYFCLSANYTLYGSKEVYNRIAGWAFDSASIWKGYVYLGSDGSIYNSASKWRLANDGSGYLASGNISWDASGNVTFGSSVSLNWTSAVSSALSEAKTYTDTAKSSAISTAATDATTKSNAAAELATAMAYGKMLYRDPTFSLGTNSTYVYNNLGNGSVTVTRTYDSSAPNDSKYVLRIVKTSVSASPESGGFSFQTMTAYRKIYITRIYAKIPSGRSIGFASNSVGTGGSYKWLTDTAGTGDWKEYIAKVTCGTASFSTTNFYYISGSTAVSWDVAYATVFDITSVESSCTTIDANGIYTGSISATQITAGTINAARIDVASIKSSIITADNINALTLTTSKGTIGGWNISSSYIYKNTVYFGSDGSIYNGTKWKLNYDGSGQLANGNISWDTSGSITAKNAIFTNVRVQGSVRNPFVLNDSTIWVGGDSSDQTNFNNYDNIVAVNTSSWTSYIPLPWTLENSGRRVTLVNYKWSATESTGYMGISAPTGQYFYEDGIAKTAISFSRECLELLGYGDSSTFFGWIVLNRINLMTTSRYGKPLRVLAQGLVTGTSSSASISYKTFDNTTMSVSRIGTGKYIIYFSSLWGITAANAVFNLTGYGYSYGSTTGPIKAAIYGVYGSFFYVNTSDDSTNNDGSFYFQITNMNDWTY